MSKIAIMTDSNSGITQIQAKELGITVIPMPFDINGQTFYEDINLTQEEFFEKLGDNHDIKTSQPSPETLLDSWESLLKEYDEIIHIPMSSGLSGSCNTAIMLSHDYEGKVQVVNNQRISVTQRQSCLDAIALADQGKSALEIKNILERDKFNASIYITVNTLEYLKKGGRLTPAVAAIGTLLKIKPVLQIQGEKLDAFAKARNMKTAKSAMIEAMKADINNRFGGLENKNFSLYVAYSHNRASAEEFAEEIKTEIPGCDIHIDPLSLSISCHIGPGALALACSQNIPELI